MRYFILSVVALLCIGTAYSQKNNPFAKRGAEFVESFNLIKKDYDAGNIKTLNEKTLAFYSSKVPLKNEVTINTATNVFKVIQSGKTKLGDVVNNATVSEASKKIIIEIVRNQQALSEARFQDFLVRKNDEIASAKVSENEREILYTLSAIAYNVRISGLASISGMEFSRGRGCLVQDEGGTAPMDNGWCVTAAATVGFLIGNGVCGILCGLGGAVIAGVATAISLS
ncbi:hypothetical protein [Ferruginibacter sp. HRS2-29]|uniref:hypothetical protein n=1 Tax=Ferruginibacter sp. HRS2-29 TaxID=2487334 RepID=UPI0020CCB847|nr:hypothetical protein [Ferruginibacter sp. HRS2-29]MCP9753058.1 hypothetical protein [Ferruginibacter sp. HRS2-29]